MDYLYGEHDAGGTAWMTLSGVAPDALGQDTHLGNRPMGELTAGALGSVPMIIGFWPVLFAGAYGVTKLKEAKEKAAQKEMVAKMHEDMKAAVAKIEEEQGPEVAEKVKQALCDASKKSHGGGCCNHGEGA